MEEIKFLKGNIDNLPKTLNENTIYIATSNTANSYSTICVGGKEWTSKEYMDSHLEVCVTREEFDDTKDKANTALQSKDIATINGETITSGGNTTIDLSLYILVDELPTENINPNKIYLLINNNESGVTNQYVEYLYHKDLGWEILGEYKAEVDLGDYLKKEDAEKTYMKLENGKGTVSVGSNGSMNNYGNNGQAFNAVRECPSSITGYKINAGSFGVKIDGTTAFSHKKYDTYNPTDGSYTGAKNTAVLTFAGSTGLRYAKNTGSAADVSEDMFKYVGVIDSLDEKQRVYSKTQVDNLISKIKTVLTSLGATEEQINGITI